MKESRNPHTSTRPDQIGRERKEEEERSSSSPFLFLLSPPLPLRRGPPTARDQRPHFLFSRSQLTLLLSISDFLFQIFFFCFKKKKSGFFDYSAFLRSCLIIVVGLVPRPGVAGPAPLPGFVGHLPHGHRVRVRGFPDPVPGLFAGPAPGLFAGLPLVAGAAILAGSSLLRGLRRLRQFTGARRMLLRR